MILYFSGTGNSQYTALQLAKIISDEVVSINQYLKKGKKAELVSERPYIFVAPTYSWRMPKVVEQWILDSDFRGSQSAYFVLTCAGSCGNAAAYAKKLCKQKGMQFRGLATVTMPECYLALFSTPDEKKCREMVEKSGPQITAIAHQIQANAMLPEPPVTLTGRLQSGPVNPLFYSLIVHDKGFTATDKCISCGKCAKRCALNNIDMVNGRPVWKGNCTHCMACIGGCPTEAIEYKDKSKGRHRHYIMNDSLCWGKEGQEG